MRFDEELLAEDLEHATTAGREVGVAERMRIERDGVSPTELIACEPEARDGIRLPGCVKTYLPQPDGDWGMVFAGDVDDAGAPVLVCLAFGRRHPQQSVAAERLPNRARTAQRLTIQTQRSSFHSVRHESHSLRNSESTVADPAEVDHRITATRTFSDAGPARGMPSGCA